MKFIRFFPGGNGKELPVADILDRDSVVEVMEKMDKERLQHPNLSISFYGISFGPNFYSPGCYKFLAGQNNVYGNSTYLCPMIGQQYLGISLGTNKIYPCFEAISFPEMEIGQMTKKDGQYSIGVSESKFTPELVGENLTGICSRKECQYQQLCLGGCRMHAYAIARRNGVKDQIYAGQDICVTRILDEQASN